MKVWRLIIILTTFLSLGVCITHAQYSFDSISALQDPLTLTVSPANPGPNQTVYVQISSSAVQVNTAKITWTLNGSVQSSFNNNPKFQLTTSKIGTSQTIVVTVKTLDSKEYTKSTVVSPASLDLIWEAHSSVPPFYKGKPLLPYQGSMTVQAVPNFSSNGAITNSKSIIYTWSDGNQTLVSASGLGKDSLEYQVNGIIMRPITLSVTATTQDGKTSASNSITIQPQSPAVVIYQKNDTYGTLYNVALPQEFTLNSDDIMLQAYPYNFTGKNENSDILTYDWSINGSTVNAQSNNVNELKVRKPSGTSGSSEISLKVSDSSRILQYSTARLMVHY